MPDATTASMVTRSANSSSDRRPAPLRTLQALRFCQLLIAGCERGPLTWRKDDGRPGRPALLPRPDASPRRRAEPGDLACGQCTHCTAHARGVEKCDLTATRGARTDIAATDAACTRFEPARRLGEGA